MRADCLYCPSPRLLVTLFWWIPQKQTLHSPCRCEMDGRKIRSSIVIWMPMILFFSLFFFFNYYFIFLFCRVWQMCVIALIFQRWKSSVCWRSSSLTISWEQTLYMAMTTTTGSTRRSFPPTSTSTWLSSRSRRPSNTSVSPSLTPLRGVCEPLHFLTDCP